MQCDPINRLYPEPGNDTDAEKNQKAWRNGFPLLERESCIWTRPRKLAMDSSDEFETMSQVCENNAYLTGVSKIDVSESLISFLCCETNGRKEYDCAESMIPMPGAARSVRAQKIMKTGFILSSFGLKSNGTEMAIKFCKLTSRNQQLPKANKTTPTFRLGKRKSAKSASSSKTSKTASKRKATSTKSKSNKISSSSSLKSRRKFSSSKTSSKASKRKSTTSKSSRVTTKVRKPRPTKPTLRKSSRSKTTIKSSILSNNLRRRQPTPAASKTRTTKTMATTIAGTLSPATPFPTALPSNTVLTVPVLPIHTYPLQYPPPVYHPLYYQPDKPLPRRLQSGKLFPGHPPTLTHNHYAPTHLLQAYPGLTLQHSSLLPPPLFQVRAPQISEAQPSDPVTAEQRRRRRFRQRQRLLKRLRELEKQADEYDDSNDQKTIDATKPDVADKNNGSDYVIDFSSSSEHWGEPELGHGIFPTKALPRTTSPKKQRGQSTRQVERIRKSGVLKTQNSSMNNPSSAKAKADISTEEDEYDSNEMVSFERSYEYYDDAYYRRLLRQWHMPAGLSRGRPRITGRLSSASAARPFRPAFPGGLFWLKRAGRRNNNHRPVPRTTRPWSTTHVLNREYEDEDGLDYDYDYYGPPVRSTKGWKREDKRVASRKTNTAIKNKVATIKLGSESKVSKSKSEPDRKLSDTKKKKKTSNRSKQRKTSRRKSTPAKKTPKKTTKGNKSSPALKTTRKQKSRKPRKQPSPRRQNSKASTSTKATTTITATTATTTTTTQVVAMTKTTTATTTTTATNTEGTATTTKIPRKKTTIKPHTTDVTAANSKITTEAITKPTSIPNNVNTTFGRLILSSARPPRPSEITDENKKIELNFVAYNTTQVSVDITNQTDENAEEGYTQNKPDKSNKKKPAQPKTTALTKEQTESKKEIRLNETETMTNDTKKIMELSTSANVFPLPNKLKKATRWEENKDKLARLAKMKVTKSKLASSNSSIHLTSEPHSRRPLVGKPKPDNVNNSNSLPELTKSPTISNTSKTSPAIRTLTAADESLKKAADEVRRVELEMEQDRIRALRQQRRLEFERKQRKLVKSLLQREARRRKQQQHLQQPSTTPRQHERSTRTKVPVTMLPQLTAMKTKEMLRNFSTRSTAPKKPSHVSKKPIDLTLTRTAIDHNNEGSKHKRLFAKVNTTGLLRQYLRMNATTAYEKLYNLIKTRSIIKSKNITAAQEKLLMTKLQTLVNKLLHRQNRNIETEIGRQSIVDETKVNLSKPRANPESLSRFPRTFPTEPAKLTNPFLTQSVLALPTAIIHPASSTTQLTSRTDSSKRLRQAAARIAKQVVSSASSLSASSSSLAPSLSSVKSELPRSYHHPDQNVLIPWSPSGPVASSIVQSSPNDLNPSAQQSAAIKRLASNVQTDTGQSVFRRAFKRFQSSIRQSEGSRQAVREHSKVEISQGASPKPKNLISSPSQIRGTVSTSRRRQTPKNSQSQGINRAFKFRVSTKTTIKPIQPNFTSTLPHKVHSMKQSQITTDVTSANITSKIAPTAAISTTTKGNPDLMQAIIGSIPIRKDPERSKFACWFKL